MVIISINVNYESKFFFFLKTIVGTSIILLFLIHAESFSLFAIVCATRFKCKIIRIEQKKMSFIIYKTF